MMRKLLLNGAQVDTNDLLRNCLNFPAGRRQMKGADILLIKNLKVYNSLFGIRLQYNFAKLNLQQDIHKGVSWIAIVIHVECAFVLEMLWIRLCQKAQDNKLLNLISSHKIDVQGHIPDALLQFFNIMSCQFLSLEKDWQIVMQSVGVLWRWFSVIATSTDATELET